MRAILSLALVGCVTTVLMPLGCGSRIVYPAMSEGPRVPDATAERLRECVDAFGGELRGEYHAFDAKVKVDEDGHVLDVTTDVPHADLAACTRIALRAMTVPEGLLKLRLAEPLAWRNGRTTPERGLVGNLVIVGVMIALADLMIEAGGITIVIAISLEIAKDVAETIREKGDWEKECDEHLNACLDSPLQHKRGSVDGSSRCLWCREKCTSRGWPEEVRGPDGKLVSCAYKPN